MKFLKKINWALFCGLSSLFLVALLLYIPSFRLHFSLLDDGLTILNAQQLLLGIKEFNLSIIYNVFLEPANGRVRPAYWLIQSLFSYTSFYNSYLFHFYRFLLFIATLLVSYIFLRRLGANSLAIFVSLFIFTFNIQNFENYYRLGPVEPLIIFIAIVLYYLIFFGNLRLRNTIFILILSVLGGLIKENFFLIFIALIPVAVLSIFKKDKKTFQLYAKAIVINLIIGCVIFFIKHTYPTAGVYASNYVINIHQIFTNLWGYLKLIQFNQTPIFEISILYLLYFIYVIIKRRFKKITIKDNIYIFLWSVIIIQLLALSPWTFVLNRYTSFVNIDLILIYALTLSDLIVIFDRKIKHLKSRNRKVFLLILFFILVSRMVTRNFFNIANYQLYAKTDSDISYGSVRDLAKRIPLNATVYVNYKKGDTNIEIFDEAKWHLKLFYNRGDINFSYLDQSNLCVDKPRYIFDRRSDRFIDATIFDNSGDFTKIAGGESFYQPINYGVVVKSFVDRTRYPNWSDNYDFDWAIYIQKGGTCVKNK